MMTKQSLRPIAMASMLSLGLFALPARGADKKATPAAQSAKGNQSGKGNGQNARAETLRAKEVSIVVVIDQDGHRRVVNEFSTRGTLPPGLAKRESLPPGLSKQLRENGSLPPGLQKHLTPVPQALIIRFPVVPVYYVRYFAGRDLIIVNTRTNLIASIIRDILR